MHAIVGIVRSRVTRGTSFFTIENCFSLLFTRYKIYEFFFFPNRNARIMTTTIIATTIKIPKLIPALNISPITLHELIVKEVIIKVNIAINPEFFP
jgi:hypothetical protein